MEEHEVDYMIELEEIKAHNSDDTLIETLDKLINLANKIHIELILESAWVKA